MKKIVYLAFVLVLSVTLVACHGKAKQEGQPAPPPPPQGQMQPNTQRGPEMSPEQKADMEAWAKFDSLSVDQQKALIAKRKAAIDKRMAYMKSKREAMEKRRDSIQAVWANFDNLTVAQQKALIDEMSPRCMGPRRGGECKGEGCGKGPGEAGRPCLQNPAPQGGQPAPAPQK